MRLLLLLILLALSWGLLRSWRLLLTLLRPVALRFARRYSETCLPIQL